VDTTDGPLAAGAFSDWLTGMRRALRGEGDSDVPCDGCTACCTSSQFVHIGPEETDTLARIPAELLFPAPRLPEGNVVMGYDEKGHCPMLVDGACSIYEHRPRTCRTYDCRIFAVTAIELDEVAKPEIARRVRRWRFSYDTAEDSALRDAVRAVERHEDLL
jgi:Fe-S-cluster containining protein